jgi:hypothetical protein
LNTGSDLERNGEHGQFYATKNSLFTTINVTFIPLLIAIGIQVIITVLKSREENTSDNFNHASYEIENQEKLMRKFILASNMTQRKDDEGNIYKFANNKCYFDSLESVEILRNEQPHFVDPGDDESDQMRRIN